MYRRHSPCKDVRTIRDTNSDNVELALIITMSSASNLKGRHYTALASRLRQLGQNLGETEVQLEAMADQLQSMQKLGVQCGSQ